MTDAEIIETIRSGRHHPAIKELYAYFSVVKKHILKNSGSKQEAEDIFQEALIIFCRKVDEPQFELRCSINTYLFSVCKLLWLDELKKKNKQIKSNFLTLTDEHLKEEDIINDIEQDKPIMQAQQALQQLGDKCKELLNMFYFKKLSMQVIAEQLGFKTEKVAKNQKYRCIEKAKEFLKNQSI